MPECKAANLRLLCYRGLAQPFAVGCVTVVGVLQHMHLSILYKWCDLYLSAKKKLTSFHGDVVFKKTDG